jgi:hypothetical protein
VQREVIVDRHWCSMSYFESTDFKFREAERHLQNMGKVIAPPTLNGHQVALVASGVILHHEWREPFNDDLNAFLSATRSIPELIQFRFGADRCLDKWIAKLDQQEQYRRKEFQDQFESKFAPFRQLPLGKERNIVLHREGVAHWEVRVKGRWGEYVGGPTTPLPSVEMPPPITREDPEFFGFADYPLPPIVPMPNDFWWAIPQADGTVRREELFPECKRFLSEAAALAGYARVLFQNIHEGQPFSLPPLA